MKNWFSRNYKTIIILSFLIPIITVALVSISHVTKWYGISNPVSWAIYLSVGIEIAALSALAAISADMGRKVYFPFGIVTLIQFIGNIYFAYSFIDVTSQSFTSWVELTSPLVEFLGVDPTDLVGHKRFLAFFAGGMLPIISLSFLHMLVKFTQNDKSTPVEPKISEPSPEPVGEETPVVDAKDIVGEVSKIRLSNEDLEKLEKILSKQTKPTVEDIVGENLEELENEFFGELEDLQSKVTEFDGFVPEPFATPEEVEELKIDEPMVEVTPEPAVEIVPEPTPIPPVVEEVVPEPTTVIIVEEIPEPTPIPPVVEEVTPEPIIEEVIPEPIIEEPIVEEAIPEPIIEEVIPEPIITEEPTVELPTDESEEEKKN